MRPARPSVNRARRTHRRRDDETPLNESARSRWEEIRTGSLVRQVLRASRGIDVYIVADPA